MMDDGQALGIALKALEPGEAIVWTGRSGTRSYAIRYVPGNVLALVMTCVVAQRTVLDAPAPPSAWSWTVLALLVLANVVGIRAIVMEMDVHWAVTDRRLLRIRRNGVRSYPAGHIAGVTISNDTLVLGMPEDGVHDDEPRWLELRSLGEPEQARHAVEKLISKRTNSETT